MTRRWYSLPTWTTLPSPNFLRLDDVSRNPREPRRCPRRFSWPDDVTHNTVNYVVVAEFCTTGQCST